MVVRANEVTVEKYPSTGPIGTVDLNCFLTDKTFPPHVTTACKVVVQPGEACALHKHEGDCEMYLVLTGKAEYFDGKEKFMLEAGDFTIAYDGESHAIGNAGDTVMEFMAVIVTTK